ncbi:MAG: hypothetical protein V5A76_03260 [Candidatus Thermoplasmatota archaeon]
MELLLMTIFGLLGAIIFLQYRDRYYPRDSVNVEVERLKSEFKIKSGYSGSHFYKLLNSYFWSIEDRSLILTSKVLQIGILALIFYNLTIENFWGFSVALISFVFSIFPPLYSQFLRSKVSPSFQFWISAALFLYAAGESLGFQGQFVWWNTFTHLIGGITVGSLILIYLFYLDEISENFHIPTNMIPILVLTFILSVSVLWENFEFFIDGFFGTMLQPNLVNTIFDMIANTIGAFFALILAAFLTPLEVFSGFRKKDKIWRGKSDLTLSLNDVSLLSIGFFSGIIALSFAIWRSDWIWGVISAVFIVLVAGMSKISKSKKIKWNLFIWSLIPLFLGTLGISRLFQGYRIFGDLAIAAIIPFLSFMILFNLVYYSRFKTNFQFTVFLMFVFSLSGAALTGIFRLLSDLYLGKNYLTGVDHLMMEFTMVTISTLAGIGFLIRYFYLSKKIDFTTLKPLISRNNCFSKRPKEDFLSLLNSFFGKGLYHDFAWITKALPFAIVLLSVFAVYTSNLRVLAISLPAFGFSIIPYISKEGIDKSIHNSFQFWFSIILIFFLIGEILMIYPRFEWWTLVVHLILGMITGLFVLLGLLFIHQNSEGIEIPPWMISTVTLTCLLTLILLEKLSVFALDSLIGTSLLGSLSYTVLDMIAALLGGVFVLQLVTSSSS